jgi:hypothetical protein
MERIKGKSLESTVKIMTVEIAKERPRRTQNILTTNLRKMRRNQGMMKN